MRSSLLSSSLACGHSDFGKAPGKQPVKKLYMLLFFFKLEGLHLNLTGLTWLISGQNSQQWFSICLDGVTPLLDGNNPSRLLLFLFQIMLLFFKFILFFKSLFIFEETGREGRKRGSETSMCGCLLCTLYWGPGRQPRHVPWLGIEPATCGPWVHRPALNPLSHSSQGSV